MFWELSTFQANKDGWSLLVTLLLSLFGRLQSCTNFGSISKNCGTHTHTHFDILIVSSCSCFSVLVRSGNPDLFGGSLILLCEKLEKTETKLERPVETYIIMVLDDDGLDTNSDICDGYWWKELSYI